jgi:hypothetical protein
MGRWSAYDGTDWRFDLDACDEHEALARARALDPSISRVVLIREARTMRV